MWKYDLWSNHKQIMFGFDEHSRAIISMINHSTDSALFLSASVDQTIRMWNVYNFQHLHVYRLNTYFQDLWLYSETCYAGFHDQLATLGTINHMVKFVFKHDSLVKHVDKTYQDYEEQIERQDTGKVLQVQLTFANNSGISFRSDFLRDFNINDISKNPYAIFYPPPTSKGIIQILTNPYKPNQFLMQIETGELCFFHQEARDAGLAAYIDQIIDLNAIKDYKGSRFDEAISLLRILPIFPSKFDMQKGDFEELTHKSGTKSDPYAFVGSAEFQKLGYLEKIRKLELVCIGTMKGTIIFSPLSSCHGTLYTRFTFHRAEIVEIGVIRNSQPQRFLVSVCKENYLKMTSFESARPELVKQIQLTQNYARSHFLGLLLVSTYKGGGFNIFRLREEGELITSGSQAIGEHEGDIVSVDILEASGILMTAALDQKLKFWNLRKQILFQINYFESINCACFINGSADILISHGGHLNIFRYEQISAEIESGQKLIAEFFKEEEPLEQSIEDSVLGRSQSQWRRGEDSPQRLAQQQQQPSRQSGQFLVPPKLNLRANSPLLLTPTSQRDSSSQTPGNTRRLSRMEEAGPDNVI